MIPIFDGHNDTLTAMLNSTEVEYNEGFIQGRPNGHIDLPRARAGGLLGGFFAIYTDMGEGVHFRDGFEYTETGYRHVGFGAIDPVRARHFTDEVIERAYALAEATQGQAAVVTHFAQLQECIMNGILAMVLQIEGAEAIAPDLSNLEAYYQRGVRSITLVWSRPNAFGHGVPFCFPDTPDIGPGLTDAGKALVKACNELGILIDLSHLNARGFWDVAEISNAPLVATHSCAHTLVASTRNLTDDQLDAIAQSGGMVGVNFSLMMVHPQSKRDLEAPYSYILDHIDYMVERMGIDHVGFGSDFDGTTIPASLKDAGGLPLLLEGLRERGYNQQALEKIAYRNWWRVLQNTW